MGTERHENPAENGCFRSQSPPDGPGVSWDSVFRPEQPKQTRPGQFRPTFGPRQKCPLPKARLFLGSRYPFHGTLLGASQRADIRKSLHSMGLRTSL